MKIRGATAFVFSVPNSGPVLGLEIDFTGDLLQVIPLLRETCFERRRLRVGGQELLEAILDTAPEGSLDRPDEDFDRDVHQLFMPAGDKPELLASRSTWWRRRTGAAKTPDLDRLARIVYRADDTYRLEYAAIKLPKELNRPSGSVAGHARGVTVLAGSAEHIENAAFVVAAQLLSAAATLREISREASRALGILDAAAAHGGKLETRRDLLASLGTELSRLQVKLSFGVEANAMPIHLPEVVMEHYQASLADSLGLVTGSAVTDKLLDRLSIAMTATAGSLLAIEQQRDNGRRQRWVIAVGWLSTAAIPLSLVFAFFGMNATEVDDQASMLSLTGKYQTFYLVLLGLVLVSVVVFGALTVRGYLERQELERRGGEPLADVLKRAEAR